MNSTFNFRRFGKVLVYDAQTAVSQFGLTLLILVLIPMAVWLFNVVLGPRGADDISAVVRWAEIGGVVMLVSMMAPSRIYRTVNILHDGIFYAMLPASKLEKYLSMLLYTIVICPLVAVVGSIIVDTLLYLLPFGAYHTTLFSNWDATPYIEYQKAISNYYSPIQFLRPHITVLGSMLSSVAGIAVFILTNTVFRKHKVLKTVLWGWILSFVLSLVLIPVTLRAGESGVWDSLRNWVMRCDPVSLINHFLAWYLILYAVIDVILLWWAGHRIKVMKY